MTEEQKKFITYFEEKYNEKVKSFELAELRGSQKVIEILNLKQANFQDSLWGLLVFCKDSTYFYISPHESYISFFIRKSSGEEEPQEQCIKLSDKNIRYSLLEKKWFNFLNSEINRTINCQLISENETCNFSFILNKKAADILSLVQN